MYIGDIMVSEVGNFSNYKKVKHDEWGAPHRKGKTLFSRKLRKVIKTHVIHIMKYDLAE